MGAVSINVIIGVVISYSDSLLLLAVITITCGATELKKSLNEEIHSEIQPTSVGQVIELDINEAYITNFVNQMLLTALQQPIILCHVIMTILFCDI